jgi:IS30 family transposase
VQFCLSYLYWSPQQIENRLRLEGKPTVSFSTIYRALDEGRLRDTLRYYLRRKYKALGKAKKTIRRCFQQSIGQRPPEANERSEPGHWEGDTIYLSKEKKYLVTLVDRCSRYLRTGVVSTLESAEVCEVVCQLLEGAPAVKSITLDRGTEFSGMSETKYADLVYFAHAGSPWERGTNENTNGLLRQFYPKRIGDSPFSSADAVRINALLNFRPRACLQWRSPYEVASSNVLHFT